MCSNTLVLVWEGKRSRGNTGKETCQMHIAYVQYKTFRLTLARLFVPAGSNLSQCYLLFFYLLLYSSHFSSIPSERYQMPNASTSGVEVCRYILFCSSTKMHHVTYQNTVLLKSVYVWIQWRKVCQGLSTRK